MPVARLIADLDAHRRLPRQWTARSLLPDRHRAPPSGSRRWPSMTPAAEHRRRSCRRPKRRSTASSLVSGRFIASYMHDVIIAVVRLRPGRQAAGRGAAARHRHRGRLRRRPGRQGNVLRLHHLQRRSRVYRYDVANGASRRVPQAEGRVRRRRRYETKQVFYKSKDGTRVPMFVTHRKDCEARRQATRRCSTATAASTSR